MMSNEWLGTIRKGDLVYIAGPMTGMPNNNHESFNLMEHLLKQRGATVMNPCDHDVPDKPYEILLQMAFQKMLLARIVVFLLGWKNSTGAKREHQIAKWLKYTIYYEV